MADYSEFGLKPEGLLLPRSEDFLRKMQQGYEASVGLRILWTPDQFLGASYAVFANALGQVSEAVQAVWDARDPNNAVDTQLDLVMALVGVPRQEATKSTIEVAVDGTPGTTLLIGQELQDPGTGLSWFTKEEVTLPGTVDASPEETGPVASSAAPITWNIITPVTGWDTAVSSADAVEGVDRDTDPAARRSREESIATGDGSGADAIRSAVLDLEFVTHCSVPSNPATSEEVVAGLTMRRQSYAVVVYPGGLTTSQQGELAAVLAQRKIPGQEATGTEEFEVVGGDGFTKTMRWYYATEIPVDVEFTVSGVAASEVQDQIVALTEAYFDGLSPGDSVLRYIIQALPSTIDNVRSVEVTLNAATDDIDTEITEIALLNSVTVVDA